MVISEIKTYGNPKYVQNVTISFTVDENGVNRLKLLLKFNITFVNSTTTIDCKFKSNPKSNEYDQQLLKTTINNCRLFQGISSNFIMKTLLENIENEKGNFIFKCPFGPTTYELKNIPFHDKYFPKIFLFQDFHMRCDSKIKTKIKNTKIYVPFFNLLSTTYVTKD